MSQITTHVLDTASGLPAAGVNLSLTRMNAEGQWQAVARGITNNDGRVTDLLSRDEVLSAGTYRVHFDTGSYFQNTQQPVFYPFVDVVFSIEDGGQHYHIPLLLSPFGYSTYRGS